MKKIQILVLALVLGTTSLFANSIVNPDVSKDEIRKQIIELVQDSNDIVREQVDVKVTFTFNTEGEIVVLKVGSTNKKVLAFIRKKLNGKVLENPGKVYKQYSMPISIK